MNTLDLKGGIIELLGQVHNQALLQHFYDMMVEVLSDTDIEALSDIQKRQLELDLKAIEDPENVVPIALF